MPAEGSTLTSGALLTERRRGDWRCACKHLKRSGLSRGSSIYDFPAEHWKHLRTTNPIESTFATVRHRTVRSKGCLSNKTALAMVFKLVQAAQNSWRRLDGHNQLPKLIVGVKFIDGIEAVRQQPQAAA